MILRSKIQNFLSFYKEVNFDMFPNKKRTTFQNHVYSNMKIPILKQAAIYGANGSGKSNFIKALDFLKKFAINKDFLNEIKVLKSKFRLVGDENREPIKFNIEFTINAKYYIYNVELNTDKIFEELFISGLGENVNILLFRRDGDKLELGENIQIVEELKKTKLSISDISKLASNILKARKYSSFLSLVTDMSMIFSDENINNCYNWFNDNLITLSFHRFIPTLISLMSSNTDVLNFTNKLFEEINIGVDSLEIVSKEVNEFIKENIDKNELIKESLEKSNSIAFGARNGEILYEKTKDIIKEFIFNQIGVNGYKGEMKITDQSDGTVRILNLIPALYSVINNETVILVDEIENSIHPILISAIIKYFSKSESKGQLIFTTHETELLNQKEIMRADEIWFTEKSNGNSEMYSLNDFKEHNTINIKNGYLQGRYGAIPYIGDLESARHE